MAKIEAGLRYFIGKKHPFSVKGCAEDGAKTLHLTWICILCPGQAFVQACGSEYAARGLIPVPPSNTGRKSPRL
jgi:hypothetical protein